jgi:uncharacterized membrane protein YagU involved in acid resistance
MSKQQSQEAPRTEERQSTSVWAFSLQIGLFAGLIWGGLKIVEYYLGFTKVPIGFLAKPFFLRSYYHSAAGFWTGWAYFILFSIAAALLYAALFRKVKGYWAGLGYGAAWWAVLYFWIGPSFGMTNRVEQLGWNTVVTDFCLFLLWGLFIGFSISFEFTDERSREPAKKPA